MRCFRLPDPNVWPATFQNFHLRPCCFLVILSLNNLSKVVFVGPLSWNVGIRLATSLLEKVKIGQLLRAIVGH
jgi:hypothetical protein